MTTGGNGVLPCSECLRATFELLRADHPALALALRNAGQRPPGDAAALCHDIVHALAALNRRLPPGAAAEERIALRRLLLVWMERELQSGPAASAAPAAAASARASAAQPRQSADRTRSPPHLS